VIVVEEERVLSPVTELLLLVVPPALVEVVDVVEVLGLEEPTGLLLPLGVRERSRGEREEGGLLAGQDQLAQHV